MRGPEVVALASAVGTGRFRDLATNIVRPDLYRQLEVTRRLIWAVEEGIWVIEEGKGFWATEIPNKANGFLTNK